MCLVGGSLDEGRVRGVVQRIIDAGRPGSLSVLSLFQRLVRLDRAAHGAKVEAPRRCRSMHAPRSKRTWRASTGAASTRRPSTLQGYWEACASLWAAMSTMAAFTAGWRARGAILIMANLIQDIEAQIAGAKATRSSGTSVSSARSATASPRSKDSATSC